MVRLLDTREAAEMLGIRPDTLKLWRHKGKGPPYVKKGDAAQSGVGYDPDDVRDWVAARKFASTSGHTINVRSTLKSNSRTLGRANA